MKKFVRISLLLASVLALSACGNNIQPSSDDSKPSGDDSTPAQTDTVKPVFSGVKTSLECEAGKEFNLLTGVSAVDDVDGDLTSKIVVTTMPELTVTNGVINPTKDDTGFFDITYSVTDKAGNKAEAFSELTITEALAEKELYKDYDFNANLGNWEAYIHEDVQGTSGVNHGKYEFNITQSDGVDWHIKYAYYNYPVSAGESYKVTAELTSNKAGKVMFNGVEKDVRVGSNKLVASFDAQVDGAKNIELQFGKIEGAFKVGLEKIEIEKSSRVVDEEQTEPVEIKTSGTVTEDWTFNKDNWHSEYSAGEGIRADVEKTADYIKVTQTRNAPGKGWAGKLLVQTKAKLNAGIKYHVTLTLEASADVSGLEYGYGGWGDDFKQLKEEYGYSLTANTPTVVSFDTTPAAEFDNPMFCLKMGAVEAGVSIKASAFAVTYDTGAAEIDFTNEAFAEVWSETTNRVSVKERTKTSLTAKLAGNAEDPYKVSTNLNLDGLGLAAGKNYRVLFTLTSSVDLNEVNVMMGKKADWDPSSLFISGESVALKAGEARAMTAMFACSENVSNAKIRIKYGNAPDGAEFTVSNLTIESIAFVEAAPTSLISDEWAFNADQFTAYGNGDNTPTVVATATDATFTATGTGDCWKAKAVIETRTELKSGNKYHLGITFVASASATNFEVGAGFLDGDFKQIDHAYGLAVTADEPKTVDFNVTLDKDFADNWGFGIFMGTAPKDSTVKVTAVVVEQVPAASETESESFVFTPEGVGHYANTDAGAQSDLYVENGVLVYDIIKLSHDSDWYNKFFLSDIVLDGGAKYIFEIVVKADVNLNASLLLNKAGDWDVRAQAAVEITTEFTKIVLETPIMTAPLKFELLFQDLHQNTNVDHAKISFQSIQIFSQAQAE